MRIRSRIAVVAMPVLALTLASCGRGDGPPLYPVHGKVMYKGQAAAGATVMFRREDPEPNTTPPVPTGQTDEEGNFSLAVDDQRRRGAGREVCRAHPVANEDRGHRRARNRSRRRGGAMSCRTGPTACPTASKGGT